MMYAAIMGYGTIGSGVAQILTECKDKIAHSAGQEISLKYVLDLREFPDSPVGDRIVHDFHVIESDQVGGRVHGRVESSLFFCEGMFKRRQACDYFQQGISGGSWNRADADCQRKESKLLI